MRRVTRDLTVEREPEVNILLHWFALIYFWLAGWRFEGVMPNRDKFLVSGMPHTSNWDGWNLILASWVVRIRMKWMVKEEFTRGIVGYFIRWTGGIPIRRGTPQNAVGQTIEHFNDSDRLVLVLSPEGTRKKTNHWKTGIYWIARGAEVPILPALMDYGRKTIKFCDLISADDDIENVIQKLWDHTATATPRVPEKQTEMRLRERDIERAHNADLEQITHNTIKDEPDSHKEQDA